MDNEQDKNENNIGSFYMGRMRPPPEPKRLLPPGLLTIIALTALAGIVWYAYPRGAEKYTNVDVPVVKADTSPIKAEPEEPGGLEVPHQDSMAFDPLTKNGGTEAEKLLPAPEQPMDKEKVLESQAPLAPSAEPPKLDLKMKEAGLDVEDIAPKAPVATPPVDAPAKMEEAAPAPKEAAKESSSSTVKAIAVDEKKSTASKAPAKSAPAKSAATATGGQYQLQLGSYRSMDDAKKDWERVKKKFASQLGSLKMRLVKADVPGKGIYYRLQAGTVSKEKAEEICAALKAAKQGCIRANP